MAPLLSQLKREALLKSPLFRAMRPEELDAILEFAAERRFAAGETIFHKGDAGSFLMGVLAGSVRIGVVAANGKEMTFGVLRQGEVFGEIALLDGKTRSADAVAMSDCTLLVVERRDFLPFLKRNDDLAIRLLAVLCDRLRRASLALEEIALLDLPARLARLLVKLGEDHGHKVKDGLRIDLKLSQKDLGTLVAASRESVNKQLRLWQEDGLLTLDRGYFVIHRMEALGALVA
jgi:CRP-like cAMP-binding protein